MTQREIDIKTIAEQFSIWEVKLKNLNSLNLQDANVISEYHIAEVLNCIFGYELVNANSIQKNFPAVDLVDKVNGIAVQVSSTGTVKKINETLGKFEAHGLHNDYDRLIVFVMGSKQKSYQSLKLSIGLGFDTERDILDFKAILHFVNFLPANKLNKLISILMPRRIDKANAKPSSSASLQKKALAMEKKFLNVLLTER